MNDLMNLQPGKKYTLVRYADFGGLHSTHIEVVEVKNEAWAQYPETIRIIFKMKRKKNLRQTRF